MAKLAQQPSFNNTTKHIEQQQLFAPQVSTYRPLRVPLSEVLPHQKSRVCYFLRAVFFLCSLLDCSFDVWLLQSVYIVSSMDITRLPYRCSAFASSQSRPRWPVRLLLGRRCALPLPLPGRRHWPWCQRRQVTSPWPMAVSRRRAISWMSTFWSATTAPRFVVGQRMSI